MSDESVMDLDKRKYYIQKYDFTMMGFLIDEDDFTVSPAISRTFTMFEVDAKTRKRKLKKPIPNTTEDSVYVFNTGETQQSKLYEYTCNLSLVSSENMDSFDVYINDMFYGTDLYNLQINTNDVVKIDIVKTDTSLVSYITFSQDLI